MNINDVKTLGELFQKACRTHGSKNAYTYRPLFRALSWTYEDIWAHAVAFVDILKKHGVKKGDRVILIGFNSPYWVAAFFGIQLRGAIAVPLSPESNPEFIKKIIAQTKAKIVFKDPLVRAERITSATLTITDVPKPSLHTFTLNTAEQSKDDIAEIVYTSGTTGDPKGVILTHNNILSNLRSARKAVPVNEQAHFISILPLFHMFEQLANLLVPLTVGAQVSYVASLNPNHLKWIFQDDHINRMLVVPEFLRVMYLRITEKAEEKGSLKTLELLLRISPFIPFMALRRILFWKVHKSIGWNMHTIISGGAALDQKVGMFWEALGIHVLQAYGLTETSPALCANRYQGRKVESVGKALEGVSLKIAEDGEILAKGANVFSGYWNNEEKTKEVFTKDGWFKTGDIGFFDKNKDLYIKGRKKFMIVLSSGENVYAEDIESELNKEPGISDSTIIGLKKNAGEEVHAVLLLKEAHVTESQQIIDRVNQRLLPYQRIQGFSIWPLDDFPRTPTRKIKKSEVAAQIIAQLQGKTQKTISSKDLSKLERIIAQILEIPEYEIKDDKRLVADLNLDSLRRIELVARIENDLSIAIDEAEIDQKTTVQDLKIMVADKHQMQIRHPFNARSFTSLATFAREIAQTIVISSALALFAPKEVRGLEHMKHVQHPTLFFSNHLSGADAFVIYGSLPWRIRRKLATAAAADRIFETDVTWVKVTRIFFGFILPIFPFARKTGQGKASLVYIGRIIDRNFSVLLFPEGQTSKSARFLPLKQGAGLLAIGMNIPIVPIKLTDTQYIIPTEEENKEQKFKLPKRHKVTVTFGKPFTVDQDMSYREATKYIEKMMKAL